MLLFVVLVLLMILPGNRGALAAWAMTALGAFLASLPGRIRCGKAPRLRFSWQGCAVCFGSCMVMVLAAGMAQMNGALAAGLMQGAASAWVFAAAAWLSAAAAARIKERRRRA